MSYVRALQRNGLIGAATRRLKISSVVGSEISGDITSCVDAASAFVSVGSIIAKVCWTDALGRARLPPAQCLYQGAAVPTTDACIL